MHVAHMIYIGTHTYILKYNLICECFDILNDILRSSEYEIIKFLALNGPSNRWEISEGTKIKYQTVYSAIKRLLGNFFIDIFDVEKARTGLDKPSYFVTFIGKLVAMAMSEKDDDVLDLIATSEPRQFSSFLILDEWEYICRSTVARKYVLSLIRRKFLDLLRSDNINDRRFIRKYRSPLLRSILWDGYPRRGVPRLNEYGRAHGSEILQFFMGNPQIRERIEQLLLELEAEAQNVNKEIRKVRREYGLKRP